jgi:predicted CoA-binding protein
MIWLQQGIAHPESKRLAEENGIEYVEDYCMYVGHIEHAK